MLEPEPPFLNVANPGITLTQVLNLDRDLALYGQRITDLRPRGDLGLGLDPEGPVGFARIRAVRHCGRLKLLPTPLVLSVYGDGREPAEEDADAQLGERIWTATVADRALRLELQHGSFAALLGVSSCPVS